MIDYPSRVRFASPEDEDRLVRFLDLLEADNGFGVPKDPDKVLEQIKIATEKRGGLIGIINGKDDDIAGGIGLYLTNWWYSTEIYIGELFLFVAPDYRANGFEKDLFQFAKWYRERMSTVMGRSLALVTSVSAPRRLPGKERLWRQNLGANARRVGSIFVLDH